MIAGALAAWCGIVALLWLGGHLRARRAAADPRFRIGPDDAAADPSIPVTVVIPARDEVRDIGDAVGAVLAQVHPSVEVVVLDDGSTDGTSDVLAAVRDPRLVVVDGGGGPLPQGWLGKPWACQRAAREATGRWVLFVDADVRLAPAAVSRAVAYAEAHELDLLSGLGQLVNVTLGERIVQPVVAGAILAGNPLEAVNDPALPDKALASGQFLLFRREAYHAIGGHEAVRDNVLDDVGLALAVKGAGLRFHLVHMRGLYRCRMYRSGAEAWRGWRKNLFPGIHRSFAVLIAAVAFQVAFLYAPYLALVLAAIGVVAWWVAIPAGAAVLAIQGLRLYLDRLFGEPVLLGQLTHVAGNALFAVLLIDSAVHTVRGTATWKGRTLTRPDRPPQ